MFLNCLIWVHSRNAVGTILFELTNQIANLVGVPQSLRFPPQDRGSQALGTRLLFRNFVPSCLPIRLRRGGEYSGEMEFLDLILGIPKIILIPLILN